MKKILALAAASTLVFAACGGDDDGDGGGDSPDDLVNALVESFERTGDTEGVALDEDCLRGVAEGLSADDRGRLITAFENDTDPEGLSPEAEAASLEVIDCIDIDFDAVLEDE